MTHYITPSDRSINVRNDHFCPVIPQEYFARNLLTSLEPAIHLEGHCICSGLEVQGLKLIVGGDQSLDCDDLSLLPFLMLYLPLDFFLNGRAQCLVVEIIKVELVVLIVEVLQVPILNVE